MPLVAAELEHAIVVVSKVGMAQASGPRSRAAPGLVLGIQGQSMVSREVEGVAA